jgi:hypothetical protein
MIISTGQMRSARVNSCITVQTESKEEIFFEEQNEQVTIHPGGYTMTDNTPQLIVYTLEDCPNCELLKGFLTEHGIPYSERDMATPESLTELRINGVFVQEAPVLQNRSVFLISNDLFSGGKVREDRMNQLMKGV